MAELYRYTELKPLQLQQRLDDFPVAIAPWGALEWHGSHLPFGLDGLVAEAFSERLARRTGAVLLPTYYLPMTSLPHPQSLSHRADTVAAVWRELIDELGRAGFGLICLISGHYAQGHELVLAEIAEERTQTGPAWVLAGTPLSLLERPDLLDHAARWETAQLLATRPDLVDLNQLGDGPLPALEQSAVLGEDPRRASAEEGEQMLQRGLDAWRDWIGRLQSAGAPDELFALYQRRRESYQSYVDRYYDGSWQAAIEAWWQDATG